MTPALNKSLPDIDALATGGVKFTPSAFAGKAIVLYFYPKDNTPGCTTEAMQFRDKHADFKKAGAVVFGVVKNKIMYGKKVKGIERSTFLINAQGVLVQEWRGIKVAGHVDEVLLAVKALKKAA
jgi:peroxiredoxin Q/BCP